MRMPTFQNSPAYHTLLVCVNLIPFVFVVVILTSYIFLRNDCEILCNRVLEQTWMVWHLHFTLKLFSILFPSRLVCLPWVTHPVVSFHALTLTVMRISSHFSQVSGIFGKDMAAMTDGSNSCSEIVQHCWRKCDLSLGIIWRLLVYFLSLLSSTVLFICKKSCKMRKYVFYGKIVN